ncbi:hypothetical protein [Paracidovorax wautersii]|uniref:Uncharacterized protein n=1 Tax=Paracidovorax wautersii TaxID=1177982 RepID=A0A1I2HUH2_9BURK|nr:hypothetical protein [Paracidovorax wautersii]SFF33855.1 hypothetical protein SAMN04489711_1382 [Paracidovorax wautersii]
MPTAVMHVDQVVETFADYRARAEGEFVSYLKVKHGALIPDSSQVTLEWAKEQGLEWAVEEAIGDEYSFWDDEESFYIDRQASRHEDLVEIFMMRSGNGGIEPVGERGKANGDDALVLAKGSFAQLVMRNWEGQVIFAIGPLPKLDDELDLDKMVADNKAATVFVAKCLAACDPTSPSYLDAAQGKPAVIEVSDRVRDLARRGWIVDAARDVIDRAYATAHSVAKDDDAAAESVFESNFGIAAGDLLVVRDEVDTLIEFAENFDGELPDSVSKQYEREYLRLREFVLDRMAYAEEQPYVPDTAWTSKRVDLSAYRTAAAIQVDHASIAPFLAAQGQIRYPLMHAAPGSMSRMSEKDFDIHVMPRILEKYPFERAKSENGLWTLYTSGPGSEHEAEGALVFRGHRSWGHLHALGALTARWLRDTPAVALSELPQWFHLSSDPVEVSEVLASTRPPETVMKPFGDLSVTGVLFEKRGAEIAQLYVTHAAHPVLMTASFRPVIVDGQWNVSEADVSSTQEVDHGR